jgi:o-succinylbenzoate synthase
MLLHFQEHTLHFVKPARTSRGEYTSKKSWIISLSENGITGTGEASPLPDLSPDGQKDIGALLTQLQYFATEKLPLPELIRLTDGYPSVQFALECAYLDLQNGGTGVLYNNPFTNGNITYPINGLLWMDSAEQMYEAAMEKQKQGFNCLKLKVGALDHDSECRLLEKMRKAFSPFKMEIRLDANGAYLPEDALPKVTDLSRFEIHSIEQPIQAYQDDAMQELCAKSPIPICLDEDLISRNPTTAAETLLFIKPTYIILKPTLLGGFAMADTWISAAEKCNIGYWSTSALEGNIGLSAIAQWMGNKKPTMPQGLGTGGLFTNNFPPRTTIENGQIRFIP